ncbi:60S acidic ribosomal protein P1 [Sesamum angolense]|uniref:60S acidic ribosomal protein P1 n=1 Tax=Sesamum angolense TaxID=2727404 RepID=A0AAE1TAT0_9LAMI|nr:60S acidic ribosomal protein P1 [Sesamum angolense]
MSFGELACTYAALILHDDGIPITAEKIATLVKAANVTVESYWPSLFAKLCEKRNIDDLIMNVGSGGGVGRSSCAAPRRRFRWSRCRSCTRSRGEEDFGCILTISHMINSANLVLGFDLILTDHPRAIRSLSSSVEKVDLFDWASSPSNANKQEAAVAADKSDDLTKGKGSPQATKKSEGRRKTRELRFAPELDGVHCFETILPY